MTIVQKSALVKYSAQQMYSLVSDIEAYSDFLPWCNSSKILHSDGDVVEAELEISKAGFHKSFVTRNKNDGGGKIILTLLDGPFSSLDGVWDFMPLREDASKISLNLEFELHNKIANLAFGKVFNHICNTMVSSFTDRAKHLYG